MGVPGADAAYVFRFNGVSWMEEQKLLPDDGAQRFGQAGAIDGTTAVIGASSDDNANGNNAGSAYVFRFNGTSWDQDQKLLASDGATNDFLGNLSTVAVRGDTILLGTRSHDHVGQSSGAVYVFSCSTPCPWDCDSAESTNDGTVGIVDFLTLLGQWGGHGSCDFDGGGVGITDFLELLANWGPCP